MESEFANKVMERLEPYFHFKTEVWSKDGKSRIDYIITDKVHGKPFGIEFKDYEDKKRGANLGDHILQSMRYACSEFPVNGKYQRLLILICPPISYNYLQAPEQKSKRLLERVYPDSIPPNLTQTREYFHDRHDKHHEHHTVNGMLGAFGIGEIRTRLCRDYNVKNKMVQCLCFAFSNRALWEERMDWNTRKATGLNLKNYEIQSNKIIPYKFL